MRLKNRVFFDNRTIYKSAFLDLNGFCSILLSCFADGELVVEEGDFGDQGEGVEAGAVADVVFEAGLN